MSNWENRHDRSIFMLYCYFIDYRCLKLNIFQYIYKMSNITSAYMKDVNRLKLVLVEQKGQENGWQNKMVLQCYTTNIRYIGQYS